MSKPQKTTLIDWLALILSIYTWFLLFSMGPILWVVLGISILVNLLCLSQGTENTIDMLSISHIRFSPSRILVISTLFILCISSIYGFIDIIWRFPIVDQSILIFPIITFSLVIGGSIINLIYR